MLFADIDILDADFPENRGQARKHRREHCKQEPASAPHLIFVSPFSGDHQKGAGADAQNADHFCGGNRLAQKQKGEQNRQHGTGFIDGRNLIDIAELQGMEIAEPRSAGRQSGQNQKT